ncbi:hypothetical protein [Planotetraspora silvatica]|nr:hypothetical protein [Planotetraspora silvatica]
MSQVLDFPTQLLQVAGASFGLYTVTTLARLARRRRATADERQRHRRLPG